MPHSTEIVHLGARAAMVCHDCGTDSGFVDARTADRLGRTHREETQQQPVPEPVPFPFGRGRGRATDETQVADEDAEPSAPADTAEPDDDAGDDDRSWVI